MCKWLQNSRSETRARAEEFTKLIEYGLSIKPHEDYTILHYAVYRLFSYRSDVEKGYQDKVLKLIKVALAAGAGKYISYKDHFGKTPLDYIGKIPSDSDSSVKREIRELFLKAEQEASFCTVS